MTDSPWREKGATLSHKNACKEFGLTEDEIFDAIRAGKLQYHQNYAHGNPYFKLLRVEVQLLAQELHGVAGVQAQEIKHQLQKVNREINSLKRKLAALEKQKLKLVEAQNQANVT